MDSLQAFPAIILALQQQTPEASCLGIAQHQALTSGYALASNLNDAILALRNVQSGNHVFQEVLDGDRLDAGVNPLGADQ